MSQRKAVRIYPSAVRPATGEYYRHRETGLRARLRRPRWSFDGRTHTLVSDCGEQWHGTHAEFWANWCHDDIYDTTRN